LSFYLDEGFPLKCINLYSTTSSALLISIKMDSSTRGSTDSEHTEVLESEKVIELGLQQHPSVSLNKPPSLESGRLDGTDSEADRDMGSGDLEGGTPAVPKEVAASDWTGPDDKENPQNWPKLIRHYHVIPPAIISFAT
jgi:hypothetical protein